MDAKQRQTKHLDQFSDLSCLVIIHPILATSIFNYFWSYLILFFPQKLNFNFIFSSPLKKTSLSSI